MKFECSNWIPWYLYLTVGLSYHGSEVWVMLVGSTEGLFSAVLQYFICCLYIAVEAT
jgi:hypothetical protein